MFLHLGQPAVVFQEDLVGIFDLDNATWAYKTREFLERAEREGRVETVGEDLPRSFVLCSGPEGEKIYLTQVSSTVLKGRAEEKGL